MAGRHAIYIHRHPVGAVSPWHAIAWVQGGGNLLLLPTFFLDAYRSGSAAAFLTIDILAVCGIVFMIWVVPDAKRVGLGARIGRIYLALSFIGTCFAFPLYLVARERHLHRTNT